MKILFGNLSIDYIGYRFVYVRGNPQNQNFKAKRERIREIGLGEINEGQPFCSEEVHPGSDCTSRSVARNQVPRHRLDF